MEDIQIFNSKKFGDVRALEYTTKRTNSRVQPEGGEEHVVHGRNSRPWLACA